MTKIIMTFASLSGLLAVTLGAFGAHGLKGKLSAELFSAFQTAVQYHFYHTLALLVVGLLLLRFPSERWLVGSGACFALGLLLFCGSLYALALGGPRWLGPVTPLGGLFFMLGWGVLFASLMRLPWE